MASELDVIRRALALHASPLFAELEPEALIPVAELASEARFAAGERLFESGDDSDAVYILTSGRVEAVRGAGVAEVLGPGDCIGEMPALHGDPRSATATALEPTEALRLQPDDLLDLLIDHPEVVRAMATRLVGRIRSAGGSGKAGPRT